MNHSTPWAATLLAFLASLWARPLVKTLLLSLFSLFIVFPVIWTMAMSALFGLPAVHTDIALFNEYAWGLLVTILLARRFHRAIA